jgi:methylmalonyl-CoA mutase N-terminal domain/subunit
MTDPAVQSYYVEAFTAQIASMAERQSRSRLYG